MPVLEFGVFGDEEVVIFVVPAVDDVYFFRFFVS